MSDEDYKVAGLAGKGNVFDVGFCNTDRIWRKQLLLTNDKYQKTQNHYFDECNNAYVKPKPIEAMDLLQNLHKKADYE